MSFNPATSSVNYQSLYAISLNLHITSPNIDSVGFLDPSKIKSTEGVVLKHAKLLANHIKIINEFIRAEKTITQFSELYSLKQYTESILKEDLKKLDKLDGLFKQYLNYTCGSIK